MTSIPHQIILIVGLVVAAGGQIHLVGGAITDLLRGKVPRDWDLEIFGLSIRRIKEVLAAFDPKTCGKRFGVLKLNINGLDVDINVPAWDNHGGVNEDNFEDRLHPGMTPEEACRRRGFTSEAMSFKLTDSTSFEPEKLIDPFNGREDFERGILRATDLKMLAQDISRVLRAASKVARGKADRIDAVTEDHLRIMARRLPELHPEAHYSEWEKILLLGSQPSKAIDVLENLEALVHYPELDALRECEQRPEWHSEGNVLVHSKLAVDAAAQLRHKVPEHQRLAFVFAALLHDVGKPSMTITAKMIEDKHPLVEKYLARGEKAEDLLLTARGHDTAGGPIAEGFVQKLTPNKKLGKLVNVIVTKHMQPYQFAQGAAKPGTYTRLHNEMREGGGDLKLIAYQCMCDACATGGDGEWKTRSLASGRPNWEHETSQRCLDHYERIEANEALAEPLVQGRDLIQSGLKPGPGFGKILKTALDLQYADETLSKDDILQAVLPQ